MALGKYLLSQRFSLSLKWKLKVPTSLDIVFCKDEMKRTVSKDGNMCLLASPTKYIKNLSTSTLDMSPVWTILACLTAENSNSLQPPLLDVACVTSLCPYAGPYPVTELIALICLPYPHTNVSFIFKIKPLVRLEKPWWSVGVVSLLYPDVLKSLFSLSRSLLL